MTDLPAKFLSTSQTLGIAETPEIVWISVVEQKLRLFVGHVLSAEYGVSTAKNGLGCRRDSYQTPVGLHRIAQKIGGGQPLGMVFKERMPTTLHAPPFAKASEARSTLHEDLILTRILWLEGLQPDVNQGGVVDTFSRYIYIHGTNHEDCIGQPASRGCIRMRNADVTTLFEAVELGSLVWIG